MVEDPQRVIPFVLGNSGHVCHRLALLDWIADLVEILSPAPWNEYTQSLSHEVLPFASGDARGRRLGAGV